ncbi:hypothetical protein NC653_014092 [Populus alba x Populus x berolinensis]|uniref:Uncharacterized protein n=1 Tax=Populus alba x Populus x berolinensis TaxID=444605 RepID=A0AAD6QW77_9ROSI|nr:hypothetical protein NC653_014092 [Populus alba x Populus x berolinensis]
MKLGEFGGYLSVDRQKLLFTSFYLLLERINRSIWCTAPGFLKFCLQIDQLLIKPTHALKQILCPEFDLDHSFWLKDITFSCSICIHFNNLETILAQPEEQPSHGNQAVLATIPTGIPPSFARPVTTVLAQPSNVSTKLSLSKIPPSHFPLPSKIPQIAARGSHEFSGKYSTGLSGESDGLKMGSAPPTQGGIQLSHFKIADTPSRSSETARSVTARKNASSLWPKDPALKVTSFATTKIVLPKGNSGVSISMHQATMPKSFSPAGRSKETRGVPQLPFSSANTSSVTFITLSLGFFIPENWDAHICSKTVSKA